MLTKLSFTRFRGFSALDVETRPVTVVLGPNSSGKTSLLHGVRVALEALAIGLEAEVPSLSEDGWITVYNGLVWDHSRLFPAVDWVELFTNKEVGEGTSMTLRLSFEESDIIQDLEVVLSYARNQQLRMTVYALSRQASKDVEGLSQKSRHRRERLLKTLKDGAPKALLIPAFYGVTSTEDYRTLPHVERMLGGGDQSRVVRNLVARLSPDAFKRMNDFLGRHIGTVLSERTTALDIDRVLHLTVSFRDSNGALELASAGAGLINLISLYAAMELFRPIGTRGGERTPVIYLLDEPEAHLHPRLQGQTGEALGALASEFGTQLLIATHSIEMINRLGQRGDALLLAVDRQEGTAVRLSSEDALVQELARWCDLSPFTSINFLASRRVLFHEGPSDAELLRRCAEIYFRSRPSDMALVRRWTPVPLGGVGKINARAVLGVAIHPQVFPQIEKGPLVRAVCILDRDTERQPGFRLLADVSRGAYQAAELVWSRHSIESLFLDSTCLSAWIALLLPAGAIPQETLLGWVNEGLRHADTDQELLDDAEKQMMLTRMRNDQLKPGDALDAARAEVRTSPHVWQKGRSRAQRVLRHVRERIPDPAIRNHVRTSLVELIRAATVEKLGDPKVLVPQEIRALLDYMIAPEEAPRS